MAKKTEIEGGSDRDELGIAKIATNLGRYEYPENLAQFVSERWDATGHHGNFGAGNAEILSQAALEEIISTCYQASLLREESVPITFRVIVALPECFPADHGPPSGLHRLVFSQGYPFTAHELRRLSPAARFHRSLVGVMMDDQGEAKIWGLIHSGPRWMRSVHGGRGSAPELPPCLVVNVTGPGEVEVCKGSTTVGQLSDGKVFGPSLNVFESVWLQEFFAPIRAERTELHIAAQGQAKTQWASLAPELTGIIDQNMMKRMIAAIRAFHHGGILVLVPPDYASELTRANPLIYLKYQFSEGEPRARFRTLIVAIMNALAEFGGRSGSNRTVGWEDYEKTHDPNVTALDEAIFEMSHLIAGLCTVDGAVVLTKRFELLGFGGVIRCDLGEVTAVARALDIEGTRTKLESTLGVGTRHRSAYALCHALRDVVAIVVSQDGGVRFVKWQGDHVTYWDHQATFTFSSRF